jgi:dTDP-4-amino-4,6-dideoxygalactose transaminase
LAECGIQTQVHYPIPPHKAPCYSNERFARGVFLPKTEESAGSELSLPIYYGMPENDVDRIIEAVNAFKRS